MHCGHLQYRAKSWHSHNYIRTGSLTVPVHKAFGDRINQATIVGGSWRRKHIRSIGLAYKDFPYFNEYFFVLREILEYEWTFLDTFNRFLTDTILKWLGIKTRVLDSAAWHFEGDAIDKIIQMCRAVGATEYLSNEGASIENGGYIVAEDIRRLADAGIKHRWQVFNHPYYGQPMDINDGRLSILDLLFVKGPEAGKIVRKSGYVG